MEPHLAEVNIARLRAPPDDPRVAEFVNALDEINALAESSPGFVWRYRTDAGHALDARLYADPLIIVNLSVWTSLDALRGYVYRSDHAKFYARRASWFEQMAELHFALWWIPAGTRPSLAEARARLEHRRAFGDTPHAFSFRQAFPPP